MNVSLGFTYKTILKIPVQVSGMLISLLRQAAS